MFLMLFLMPEGTLSKEELSKVQELATKFGVILAKQLNLGVVPEELGEEDATLVETIEAGEHVIDDQSVIGYLEDCLRLPDQSAEH
jgi:hypothetical protein